MKYSYITENNLENRQTYQYTKFAGLDFLNAYKKSRMHFLESIPELSGVVDHYLNSFQGDALKEVAKAQMPELLQQLITLALSGEVRTNAVDLVLKRFEVRKRLYLKYVTEMKPQDENDYYNIELYLLFAVLMKLSYQATGNLKYLNALLKVDDTILSIENRLETPVQLQIAHWAIKAELQWVKQLAESKEITL